ncbi:MAG: hypothetical protein LBV21_06910, partial [Candidatus Adiutrix sp.]|nr:hypothetical protein [Candidatus Adiutrix sp.]
NESRYIREIAARFPDYGSLSLPDKLQLGVSRTLSYLFTRPQIIFITLALLLPVAAVARGDSRPGTMISCLPILLIVLFQPINQLMRIQPFGEKLRDWAVYVGGARHMKYGLLHFGAPDFSAAGLLLVALLGVGFLCVLLSLYFTFARSRKKALTVVGLNVLGVFSSIIMAFSPGVWFSNWRTGTFMFFSFILTIVLIRQELAGRSWPKLKSLDAGLFVLGGCNIGYHIVRDIIKGLT